MNLLPCYLRMVSNCRLEKSELAGQGIGCTPSHSFCTPANLAKAWQVRTKFSVNCCFPGCRLCAHHLGLCGYRCHDLRTTTTPRSTSAGEQVASKHNISRCKLAADCATVPDQKDKVLLAPLKRQIHPCSPWVHELVMNMPAVSGTTGMYDLCP